MSPSVCRKAKTIFGLKVKKKKKKVNTDLVLANKGALGKAWKTNTHTTTHTTAGCVCVVARQADVPRCHADRALVKQSHGGAVRRSCRSSGPLWV